MGCVVYLDVTVEGEGCFAALCRVFAAVKEANETDQWHDKLQMVFDRIPLIHYGTYVPKGQCRHSVSVSRRRRTTMALVPCRQCYQPFYASCHEGSCLDALCPLCEYGDGFLAVTPATTPGSITGHVPDARIADTRVGSLPIPGEPIAT